MFFQAKCMAAMKSMVAKNLTMLFVSHDSNSIKSLCTRAILLDGGKIVGDDTPDKVMEKYFAMKVETEQRVIEAGTEVRADTDIEELLLQTRNIRLMSFIHNDEFIKRASFQRIQNGKANFKNIQLLDAQGNAIHSVEYNQYVTLRMSVEVREDVAALGCGYHIQNKNGMSIVNSNLTIEDKVIHSPKMGERYSVDWTFKASLMQGTYNILCVLSIPIQIDIDVVDFCDYIPCAYQFEMQRRKTASIYGYVHWDNAVNIIKCES
jgi:lipopolysaccharide transport system ATP-binding protein